MLDLLIESRGTCTRGRALTGGIVSVAAHAILITALVKTSVDGREQPAAIPPDPIIFLVPEPEPDRSPAPSSPWPRMPTVDVAIERPPLIPLPTILIDVPGLELSPLFDPRAYPAPGASVLGRVGDATGTAGLGATFLHSVVEDRPVPLTCPGPVYPAALRRAGVEGDVLAEFVIGTDGHIDPETVTIVEASHDGFERAVIAMYRDAQCVFRPGRVAGEPVRVLVRQATAFRMR